VLAETVLPGKIEVDHVVCAFCGCVCDDLTVTIEDGHITGTKHACALGRAWLLGHSAESDRPAALIEGQPASLDEAVEAAAQILVKARYPLIYGLSSTYCEAQRQAVALADVLNATIDCCTSVCHGPSGMALQSVGEPTCTLGEVKNRADLLIYWGSNPAESHPRHFTRYTTTPKGLFTPKGRKGRTVILVDVRPTPSVRGADIFLQIKPGKDFECLWALRALIRGKQIREEAIAETGLTLAQLQDLAERMKSCRFGVMFIGQGLTQSRGKHWNTAAVFTLVRDLYAYTKFAVIPMRGHGNVTGIDSVLAWQTGFPFGVNFSRGYPRFNPGEFTVVDLLTRDEADAALVIASDPAAALPRRAVARLKQIPTIVLDTRESETAKIATVCFTTATAGISAEGTVYRMDHIPLRLRKFLPSPYLNDEEVLTRLVERVTQLKTEA
jgi:formylmethanofuran dehydrogenase subunit B